MLRLSVLLVLGCMSCTAAGPTISEAANEVNAFRMSDEYLVNPGDTIEVRVANRPDWNQIVLVQPDGRASFLSLDHLPVAGLTTEQLDDILTDRYAAVLEGVDLSVNPAVLAPRTITVLGEVRAPGVYPLQLGHPVTLIDALGLAGGFIRDRARLKNIVLVRWDPHTGSRMGWKIDAREENWTGPGAILLQQYDLVYVPNTIIDDVNIWIDKYIRRNIPFPNIYTPLITQ